MVMQALKLGFARRVLAEAKRKRNPAQSALFAHTPQHIWQKRFYDFNVWTERKRIEKLRYMHRNPVKRGLVASPRALEVEQLSSVRPWGNWGGESKRVGNAEDEDSTVGCLEPKPPTVSAVYRPTSRKAREVGHPQSAIFNAQKTNVVVIARRKRGPPGPGKRLGYQAPVDCERALALEAAGRSIGM
jgi:hypothetical protein